eukprot:tig00021254_g19732.t1
MLLPLARPKKQSRGFVENLEFSPLGFTLFPLDPWTPRKADNPRHWRCGPPLYPHQDDPDEGPEGGAPAASSSAAASTAAATAGSSEPPAASEAPSSGDAGSSGGPAAGLEREVLSSSAIAPGLSWRGPRPPQAALARAGPGHLGLRSAAFPRRALAETLRHMFPARRVRLLAAQKADPLCRKLFSWLENGVNEARCTRASCHTGDCYLCSQAKAAFVGFAGKFDVDTDGVLVRRPVAPHGRFVPVLPESGRTRPVRVPRWWGHRGASIVARRILLRFWWPGMLAAVARYVRSCPAASSPRL